MLALSIPRPCTYPGCGTLVRGGGRCETHRHVATGTFADRARGSRQERGYGADWDRRRRRILKRDQGLCQPCLRGDGLSYPGSRVTAAQAVDHRVPRAEGGTDDDENLQAICRACHTVKTQAEALRARAGQAHPSTATGATP